MCLKLDIYTLQSLYDLGARRVLVTGTGPLGCVPGELASQGSQNGECAPEPQRAADLFNPRLTQMLQGLNSQIGTEVFIASNTQGMLNNFLNNPQSYGKLHYLLIICLMDELH